jgi:hypothetical protein
MNAESESSLLNDMGSNYDLKEVMKRNGSFKANFQETITIRENERLLERFLDGSYPWRVSPKLCQFMVVKILGENYDKGKPEGVLLEQTSYMNRYAINNRKKLDFLRQYVEVTIRREMMKIGTM